MPPEEEEEAESVSRPVIQKTNSAYRWRTFSPRGWLQRIRWLVVGGERYASRASEAQLDASVRKLARLIKLLREYQQEYGMPEAGGPSDREKVLLEVVKDLSAGGTPIWALAPIMQRVTEGLTGHREAFWDILPKTALKYDPVREVTSMTPISRGFNFMKLVDMEDVAVRLASFASNTESTLKTPSEFPSLTKLQILSLSVAGSEKRDCLSIPTQQEAADRILSLASLSSGLFFFVNSKGYRESRTEGMDPFWIISDEERELFARLACGDAMTRILSIDRQKKDIPFHRWYALVVFRALAPFGVCAFWFGGGWIDCFVAGCLGGITGLIALNKYLSKVEKIVYEVLIAFLVGMSAEFIALTWPDQTCYQAIAIAAVIDVVLGFKIVWAVTEIMSKAPVTGSADLIEGILFTGVIAYFLGFGQQAAAAMLGAGDVSLSGCRNSGVSQWWYFLLVPLASLGWSGSFTPYPQDLIPMVLHACLAFAVNFGLASAGAPDSVNNLVSSAAVTFTAGVVSRFTGKQAVGNTVAGLYVVVPGAYLVRSIFVSTTSSEFFVDIISRAVVIGVGAWFGSLLCSPTLIGANGMLLWQYRTNNDKSLRRRFACEPEKRAMVYF